MKLDYLRYFLIVCKHCNLSRAAEELYVSQPTLSHAISNLEKEFGVSLFTRYRNGLRLTEDGKKLQNLSEGLLQHANEVIAEMTAHNSLPQPVRLGLPPVIGSLVFPEVFQILQNYMTDLRFDIMDIGSLASLPLIADGTLDAGIVSHSPPLSSAYHSLLLRKVPVVLYMSIENPAAILDEYDFTTGPNLPLVLLKEDSFITSYIKDRFKKENRKLDTLLYTNNLHAIRNMLDNNSAATFLYEGSLSYQEENIVAIPLKNHVSTNISLVWSRKQKPKENLERIIRILQTHPPATEKISPE